MKTILFTLLLAALVGLAFSDHTCNHIHGRNASLSKRATCSVDSDCYTACSTSSNIKIVHSLCVSYVCRSASYCYGVNDLSCPSGTLCHKCLCCNSYYCTSRSGIAAERPGTGPNTGVVIGAVVGGLAGLAALGYLGYRSFKSGGSSGTSGHQHPGGQAGQAGLNNPGQGNYGPQSPYPGTSGVQSPPSYGSPAMQGPIYGSAGLQGPIYGSEGMQSPIYGNAGLQGPVYGNAGLQGPVYGSEGMQSPAYTNAGLQGPVYGSEGMQSPAYSNAGLQGPVYGSEGMQSPIQGNAGLQGPAYGNPMQSPVQSHMDMGHAPGSPNPNMPYYSAPYGGGRQDQFQPIGAILPVHLGNGNQSQERREPSQFEQSGQSSPITLPARPLGSEPWNAQTPPPVLPSSSPSSESRNANPSPAMTAIHSEGGSNDGLWNPASAERRGTSDAERNAKF